MSNLKLYSLFLVFITPNLVYETSSLSNHFSLKATPKVIEIGFTKLLKIDCRLLLSDVNYKQKVVSIVLSRRRNTHKQDGFHDIVALSTFFQKPQVAISLNGTVSGHLEQANNGYSYLSVTFSKIHPDYDIADYKCVGRTINNLGQQESITENITVTAFIPTCNEIKKHLETKDNEIRENLDIISKQNLEINETKANLSKSENDLLKTKKDLEKMKNDLTKTKILLQNKTDELLNLRRKICFEKNELKSTYKIGKLTSYETNVAQEACEKFEGYLAEINSEAEWEKIKGIIKTRIVQYIAFGMQKTVSGTWKNMKHRNDPICIRWDTGNPTNGAAETVGYITKSSNGTLAMINGVPSMLGASEYICEIPSNATCY